jgi:hypothetical protein
VPSWKRKGKGRKRDRRDCFVEDLIWSIVFRLHRSLQAKKKKRFPCAPQRGGCLAPSAGAPPWRPRATLVRFRLRETPWSGRMISGLFRTRLRVSSFCLALEDFSGHLYTGYHSGAFKSVKIPVNFRYGTIGITGNARVLCTGRHCYLYVFFLTELAVCCLYVCKGCSYVVHAHADAYKSFSGVDTSMHVSLESAVGAIAHAYMRFGN